MDPPQFSDARYGTVSDATLLPEQQEGISNSNDILGNLLADFDATLLDEFITNDDAEPAQPPASPSRLLDDLLSLNDDESESAAEAICATTAQVSAPIVPLPASQSTTSRARQKAEMAYLREQVLELEAELDQIKRSTPTTPNAETGASELEQSMDSGAASLWEKIAKHQFDERHRAEVENIKLRDLLEGQLRVARSLEKLLRKRSLANPDAVLIQAKRHRTTPFSDSQAIFAEIRSRLPQHFDNVTAAISEAGLANAVADLHEMSAKTDASGSIFAEMVMVKVLPFAVDRVAEAMWQCLSANRIQLQNGYYSVSDRSDSECYMDLQLQLRVRRSETTMHVKGIGARRDESERTMFVFDTVGLAEGPLFTGEHLNCRETGYSLVERHPSSTDRSPSTAIKTCVRMWPESVGAEGDTPHTGRFLDLLIGSYNQNTKLLIQFIENMLLSYS